MAALPSRNNVGGVEQHIRYLYSIMCPGHSLFECKPYVMAYFQLECYQLYIHLPVHIPKCRRIELLAPSRSTQTLSALKNKPLIWQVTLSMQCGAGCTGDGGMAPSTLLKGTPDHLTYYKMIAHAMLRTAIMCVRALHGAGGLLVNDITILS